VSRALFSPRQWLTLAALLGVSFTAWAAGADLGQADKQATNWTAIGMFGVFLFLTYYLQQTLGFSPVSTGLAFLPMVGALLGPLVDIVELGLLGPSPRETAALPPSAV